MRQLVTNLPEQVGVTRSADMLVAAFVSLQFIGAITIKHPVITMTTEVNVVFGITIQIVVAVLTKECVSAPSSP